MLFFSIMLGAGNIGDKGHPTTERKDRDIIPEAAIRQSLENADYHTGRGGAGNEHLANGHPHNNGQKHKENGAGLKEEKKTDTSAAPTSLADKLKEKLLSAFK